MDFRAIIQKVKEHLIRFWQWIKPYLKQFSQWLSRVWKKYHLTKIIILMALTGILVTSTYLF